MPTTTETCANCGAIIGRLQAACIWREHVVCERCRSQLDGAISTDLPSSRIVEYKTPTKALTPLTPARLLAGEIICPNPHCGYAGKPEQRARGSVLVIIVLFLLMVLPAILYMVIYSGYDNICPRCKMNLGRAT